MLLLALVTLVVQVEASKNGTKEARLYRIDGQCGPRFQVAESKPAECNPRGSGPCCNKETGRCGQGDGHCSCPGCVDFRLVEDLRRSGEECVVGEFNGFLRRICYDEGTFSHYFRCVMTNSSYVLQKDNEGRFSRICEEDASFYQACGTLMEAQDSPCNSLKDHTNLMCSDLIQSKSINFQIPKEKRCAGSNLSQPYCSDFLDQTNCTDTNQVGGYCTVNGSQSSISKIMLCSGKELCDDDSENNCKNASASCRVHKHHLCDGEADCPDKSDENNDVCRSMTRDQRCIRKFGSVKRNLTLPHSWIMDGEQDCLNGLDELKESWADCFDGVSKGPSINGSLICDHQCDNNRCEDENECNHRSYGIFCQNRCDMNAYLPVHLICNGSPDCLDGVDEANCEVEDTTASSCIHFEQKEKKGLEKTVKIKDNTRCAIFDLEREPPIYPYCTNFVDQTNCTDIDRVGGYCEVKGHLSSISKIMVCAGKHQICDDNLENWCKNTSSSCQVHKHRLCDGKVDCSDGSDESHEDCKSMTKDQRCVRKFGIIGKNATLPHSWIMDNDNDCIDGLDEVQQKWAFCLGNESNQTLNTDLLCDEKCDTKQCEDESNCNGYSKGMICTNSCNKDAYLPVQKICDGSPDCREAVDEANCEVDKSVASSCVHYQQKKTHDLERIVPIHDSTRCAIFDLDANPPVYPYCADFADQTNCCDKSRVGGYCERNGSLATISKTMVCKGFGKLCDDNLENNCVNASTDCQVHKHRLCDGRTDCQDGSDETHDDCASMTVTKRCIRRFGIQGLSISIPSAWIMDNEVDCLSKIDEMEDKWKFCSEKSQNGQKNIPCDSKSDETSSSVICDGKCDSDQCEDESECNDKLYGMRCKTSRGKSLYLPVALICDNYSDCVGDEDICKLQDYTTEQTCVHYVKNTAIVPIHNFTRCAIFKLTGSINIKPYCKDFLDQTNCTDESRVGGYCEVNGSLSNISSMMVCSGNKLCDDNSENNCVNASSSCRVHKHRLCDGRADCSDRSDESHEDCRFMTKDQRCIRKFGAIGENITLPHSWIMDKEQDCLDNLDEMEQNWGGCLDKESERTYKSSQKCDGKCDANDCKDESDCNCQQYGMTCKNRCNMKIHLPVQLICNGIADCFDGADEVNCEAGDLKVSSCIHFEQNATQSLETNVPITNNRRCAIFDFERVPPIYPYCASFVDQTNCSDINRVGGYCEVKGHLSSISKIMVCAEKNQLCDDNLENSCRNTSSICQVHKHKLCDGVMDCPDGSDENHDDCKSMTKDQKCVRKFGTIGKNITLPHSWIMDKQQDCINGLDEKEDNWAGCSATESEQNRNASLRCGDGWVKDQCRDEKDCNCQPNGLVCRNMCNARIFLPVQGICNGSSECFNGVDEAHCGIGDRTMPSCIHFQQKEINNANKYVPLHDFARCASFNLDASPPTYPYCADFVDQTNCTDIDRVGGYCEVKGRPSSISKIMVCWGKHQICDDNLENSCRNTSSCQVHKHRLCDGKVDCSDGSDESHEDCKSMTKDQRCVRRFGIIGKNATLPHSWIMDNEKDCLDGLDEEEGKWVGCSDKESNGTYNFSLKCNNECDINSCEDESDCSGRFYGMTCMNKCNKRAYLPVQKICDGSQDCLDDSDETNCNTDDYTAHTCIHFQQNETLQKLVPIHENTRCAIFNLNASPPTHPYCANFLDQTNCSDVNRVGGYCEVNGSLSSISKSMVCGTNKQLCDDNLENKCEDISSHCRGIHKHRLCDGVEDCSDGSDEAKDSCTYTAQKMMCVRRFGIPGKISKIPASWLKDKDIDCLHGLDEDEGSWGSCVVENNKDEGTNSVGSCQEAFICPGDDKSLVTLDQFCDSKESCGGRENEICGKSIHFLPTKTIVDSSGSVKNLCNDTDTNGCKEKDFNHPQVDILGVNKTKLRISNESINCSDKFGEYYVYLSCMGLCENSSCPLKNQVLKYDSCPQQYSNRVFTLANNSYLTFVTRSEHSYHNDYFQCDNGRCVNFSQVCDLVNDCGDMSDEQNCTNHFTCEDDNNHLLSLKQKCDGVHDCHDLSDECNDSCGKMIIDNLIVRRLCWSIGIIAVLLSCRMLLSVVKGLIRSSKFEHVLYTKAFLMLTIFGNLLTAIYVIILSIYDISYGESFCRRQGNWLTGIECSALGIVSTIGTELSIFSLTFLTLLRLNQVKNNYESAMVPASKSSFKKLVVWMSLILVAAVFIAFIPLIPVQSFEDYFTQGMFYEEDYKLFTGFNSRVKQVNIVNEYYFRGNSSTNLTMGSSWREIGDLIDGMFSQNYGTLTRKKVHFYGNDELCLFKYIIKNEAIITDNHEISSATLLFRSNLFTWIVVILNSQCFFVMLIAVASTFINRKNSMKDGEIKNSEHDRTKYFEHIILAIVVTDFVCWIPYAIISTLHNLTMIDVSRWYQPMSLTLLTLNSVMNPLICLIQMNVKKLNRARQGLSALRSSKSPPRVKVDIELTSFTPASMRKSSFENPEYVPLSRQ